MKKKPDELKLKKTRQKSLEWLKERERETIWEGVRERI